MDFFHIHSNQIMSIESLVRHLPEQHRKKYIYFQRAHIFLIFFNTINKLSAFIYSSLVLYRLCNKKVTEKTTDFTREKKCQQFLLSTTVLKFNQMIVVQLIYLFLHVSWNPGYIWTVIKRQQWKRERENQLFQF